MRLVINVKVPGFPGKGKIGNLVFMNEILKLTVSTGIANSDRAVDAIAEVT